MAEANQKKQLEAKKLRLECEIDAVNARIAALNISKPEETEEELPCASCGEKFDRRTKTKTITEKGPMHVGCGKIFMKTNKAAKK